MQYILSEEEMRALQDQAQAVKTKHTQALQDLCTLAALHVPVTRQYQPSEPWGCILSDIQRAEYCDDCPAVALCPCTRKRYSQ